MDELLRRVVPVLPVEFESPAVVADGVGVALRTAADEPLVGELLHVVGIEGDVGGEAHREADWQLAVDFDVVEEARHVARLPFRGGVERDAHKLVVDERVVEAVLDGRGELFEVFLVERQSRDDLFVEHFVHEALHIFVVHAVAHDVEAREVRAEDEAGVGAVEYAHLAFLVGRNVGDDDAVEAGFLERQLLFEPRWAFDVPYAEDFADVYELVVVAVLFVEARCLRGVFDAARHDAVDERRAECAFAAPFSEIFFKPPLRDVLFHALFELFPVVVDELAGEYHDGLFAGLPTLVEHLRKLRWEG